MKTVFMLLGSLICTYSFCQDSVLIKFPLEVQGLLQYDFPESYGISGGVIGHLTSPIHKKNYKNSSDFHLLIFSIEAGWLHYPLNSSAINTNAGIGFRISKYPGHYHEWLVEQGILRTFYQGAVYSITLNGNVKELSNFGRTYAITGFSYLQCWNLNYSNHPYSLIIKPSFWIQYPFNGFIKAHTSFKIGVRYTFSNKKGFIYAP